MKRILLIHTNNYALVDDEDFEILNQYHWSEKRYGHLSYVTRQITISKKKQKMVKMHKIIIDCPSNLIVDHIDGNGLNNQKSNLRVCTKKENNRNRRKIKEKSSQYKGVSIWTGYFKDKIYKYWNSRIRVDNKLIVLGRFTYGEEGEIKAALEYDKAAIKYFGEFANINFPSCP